MYITTPTTNYTLKEVTAEEWYIIFSRHVEEVFPDEGSIPNFESWMTDREKERHQALESRIENSFKLYYLVFDGDIPIGWHFGFQRSSIEYFMANTAVLPAYQNKGVYSALLKRIIDRAADEGFHYVTSIHYCDNNAVLVPKLKAGFIIQSIGFLIQPMMLEANYGPMVGLVYPVKEAYRKLFSHRAGQAAANKDLEVDPS